MPHTTDAQPGSTLPAVIGQASPSRRQVLRGVAAAGVVTASGLLVACGGGDDSGGTATAGSGTTTPATTASSSEGSSGGGQELAKTSEIPVGGGVIFDAQKVVVTQPTKNDFKAFSAICTHQGCVVSNVSNGIISCPCHGSQYSVKDGSVQGGPAPRPLPEKSIKVEGSEIVLA
jgi:Rieske Fe-S protein